jgi:hypothetical protein
MNEATDKPKKPKVFKCWSWRLPEFNSGAYQINGRPGFQLLIAELIEDWPLTNPERAMMAYFAERIWRDGECVDSSTGIIRDIMPDLREYKEKQFAEDVREAIGQLLARKLIKRTALCTCDHGQIIGTAEATYCRRNHPHRFEILNVPLRNLLTKR